MRKIITNIGQNTDPRRWPIITKTAIGSSSRTGFWSGIQWHPSRPTSGNGWQGYLCSQCAPANSHWKVVTWLQQRPCLQAPQCSLTGRRRSRTLSNACTRVIFTGYTNTEWSPWATDTCSRRQRQSKRLVQQYVDGHRSAIASAFVQSVLCIDHHRRHQSHNASYIPILMPSRRKWWFYSVNSVQTTI